MKRRDFFQKIIAITSIGGIVQNKIFGQETKGGNKVSVPAEFRFDQPIDGAVLHERSGSPLLQVVQDSVEKLRIQISGQIPDPTLTVELIDSKKPDQKIKVQQKGKQFSAIADLTDIKTEFIATLIDTTKKRGKTIRTRVIWTRNSFPRYRFQIDDNSFFIRDIIQKKYKTLFLSPYLKNLKELHTRFGTKFVLNLFYSTPEGDFNLSQFPDEYKKEWEDNAYWLKLAFHAKNEFPDHPYLIAPSSQLAADIDLIEKEIKRFAGEEVYTRTNLLHWGSIQRESLKILVQKGFKTLSGSAWPLEMKGSQYIDKYQIPQYALRYFKENNIWYDFEMGLLFSKIDLCCNRVPLADTLPLLQKISENRNKREVMDLGTHEQYFWSFYKNYLPDHWKRLEITLRYMLDHGYKPIFPEEDPWIATVNYLQKQK